MTDIHYLTGDATQPVDTPAIIAHVCNDQGGWGAGFVLALSRRWTEPEKLYREWARSNWPEQPFALGEVQIAYCDESISVANMVAQHGYSKPGEPAIRYEALENCLGHLFRTAEVNNRSVHMPRIGCGLAGGTWEEIEPIIQRTLTDKGIEVYVYDLA